MAPPIAPVTAPATIAPPSVPCNPKAPAAARPTPPVKTPTPTVAAVANTAIPTFFQSTFSSLSEIRFTVVQSSRLISARISLVLSAT